MYFFPPPLLTAGHSPAGARRTSGRPVPAHVLRPPPLPCVLPDMYFSPPPLSQRATHPREPALQLAALPPDLEFAEAPALRQLPRLVFALMRR